MDDTVAQSKKICEIPKSKQYSYRKFSLAMLNRDSQVVHEPIFEGLKFIGLRRTLLSFWLLVNIWLVSSAGK